MLQNLVHLHIVICLNIFQRTMTPDLLWKGHPIHISSDIFVISMILMNISNSPYFFVNFTVIPVHFYCFIFCFKLYYAIGEVTLTFLFFLREKPIQNVTKTQKPTAMSSWHNYNHGHNIVRILILYQIFCSPQVKRSVVISNKYGLYELPHNLPNDLRLIILRNYQISGKSQN